MDFLSKIMNDVVLSYILRIRSSQHLSISHGSDHLFVVSSEIFGFVASLGNVILGWKVTSGRKT